MSFRRSLFLLFTVSIYFSAFTQEVRVYPTHWWTGMKWNQVQLLLRASETISHQKISISYPGVTIKKIHPMENGHYVAVDISISPQAKPGKLHITLSGAGSQKKIEWSLKSRRPGNGKTFAQGVRSSDFIYFLMPDRFSNGDESNDRMAGLKDQSLDRKEIFKRHGGDLRGIIHHLDYLQSLGVTALWLTPVLQNDMPDRTEHGYAITDHYAVEPRFGGNAAYHALSDSLHRRGMKLIQDAVYNHMGLYHFLMQDPPAKDWVHQWPVFTKPNYRDQTHFDPYASKADKKKMADGWFTEQMPDFNQGNPYVSNFLIQHALWCVEEFGVDGWRIDTYIYVDMAFMNRCNKALMDEYPRISLVGESWVDATANQAYFTRNIYQTKHKVNLPGTIDFQTLFHGIMPALNQPPEGIARLYQTLSNDFLYEDPMRNLIFLDNHDMSRFFSVIGENVKKMKMAVRWLFTERGIPQLYYGTEVLMKGISNPDGWVRLDFPGGWQGDKKNAFTGEGLTDDERSMLDLVRRLGNFRKNSSALKTGKRMHFVPEQGVYVYFRYNARETIMCIMNTSGEEREIDFSRFSEMTSSFSTGVEVISRQSVDIQKKANIPADEMWVLKLGK